MKVVAVVGASGFVGSVVTERLLAGGQTEIRPLIHSTGNAWRLARRALPLRPVDLCSAAEAEMALEGCTEVVNCARGEDSAMTTGFRNLLRAARRTGVRRLVHLSSVAVYGDPPPPSSESEEAPARPARGSYGWTKLKQDEMVAEARREGLPAVVLCPPNISGPHSPFLLGLVDALRAGMFALLDDGSAPVNLVDVDSLAAAVELALSCPVADGRRIFVTDAGSTTWRDLVEAIQPLVGSAVSSIRRDELLRLAPADGRPPRSPLRTLRHLVSGEVRAALRRDPLLAAMDGVLRSLARGLPARAHDRLRMMIEGPIPVAKAPVGRALDPRLCAQQLRGVRHSSRRAEQILGYRPVHSFARSMARFRAWYRVTHGVDTPWADLLAEI